METFSFESELVLDTLDDGLCVERLLLLHLKLYSDARTLVLVISTLPADETFLLEQLQAMGVQPLPKIVDSALSQSDRRAMYMQGGVQFVTSRILITDLLRNVLPVEHVAGIVVVRAQRVLRSFQESFILRMYRQRKSDGFIKAFTDVPSQIAGLGRLQRMVSSLYVHSVILLPRFEARVKKLFEENAAELIELAVTVNSHIASIESCLSLLITKCLGELRSCANVERLAKTKDEENEEYSIEEQLRLHVHNSPLELDLKRRLADDPNTVLPEKVQRLLDELSHLREIMRACEQLDAVTVYEHVENLFKNRCVFASNSGWLFTKSASDMRMHARAAVGIYADEEEGEKTKKKKLRRLPPQRPPKWDALFTVLAEIREQHQQQMQSELDEGVPVSQLDPGHVLVLANNDEVARQIYYILRDGAATVWRALVNKVHKCTGDNPFATHVEMPPHLQEVLGVDLEEDKTRNAWPMEHVSLYHHRVLEDEQEPSTSEAQGDKSKEETSAPFVQDVIMQAKIEQRKQLNERKRRKRKGYVEVDSKLQTTLDTFNSSDNTTAASAKSTAPVKEVPKRRSKQKAPEYSGRLVIKLVGERYNLTRALQYLQPTYIVLYQCDIVAIRLLEIYATEKKLKEGVPHNVRIYMLMSQQSTEEQRYMQQLHSEQTAFESLIRENALLLIPNEVDLYRPPTASKDGGADSETTPRVVVDIREFNSELPAVLWSHGIDIVPMPLEVGDYILAPDVCVERKSLDDLAQSLSNGRVHIQTTQMQRHYSKAVLLIEDTGRSRQPTPFSGSSNKSARSVRAKLTILTRLHPRLRLLWSTSPQMTVQMFVDLKAGNAEPDIDAAEGVRWDATAAELNSTLALARRTPNATAVKFLQRLPGITEGNARIILAGSLLNEGKPYPKTLVELIKEN